MCPELIHYPLPTASYGNQYLQKNYCVKTFFPHYYMWAQASDKTARIRVSVNLDYWKLFFWALPTVAITHQDYILRWRSNEFSYIDPTNPWYHKLLFTALFFFENRVGIFCTPTFPFMAVKAPGTREKVEWTWLTDIPPMSADISSMSRHVLQYHSNLAFFFGGGDGAASICLIGALIMHVCYIPQYYESPLWFETFFRAKKSSVTTLRPTNLPAQQMLSPLLCRTGSGIRQSESMTLKLLCVYHCVPMGWTPPPQ